MLGKTLFGKTSFAGKTPVSVMVLFSLFLMLSPQIPAQAQTIVASVIGWVGNNGVTTLWPDIQATNDGTGVNGLFNVAGLLTPTLQWSVGGSCHAITFSKDSKGQHASVVGWVFYNGGALKQVPAVATLNITQAPNGVTTVGIKVVTWSGGALLASTSLDANGVPLEMPLIQGSSKIVTGAVVGGKALLQDTVTAVQPLTFEFRPTNGLSPFTRTTTLTANGSFTLTDIPHGNYIVHIKGAKWLARNVAVDITNGNVSNVTATLLAGDADNNNVVDFDDLTILAVAYNTVVGDPLYDARADFNGDGQVEFADLTLLAINYNLEGDP